MADFERLQKCSQAFPGIEEGEHKYTIERLLQDALTDEQGNRPRWNKQTDLGSGTEKSTLIAHAETAIDCGRIFQRSDQEPFVEKQVSHAEEVVAKSILERDPFSWHKVMKLSSSIDSEMTDTEKSIYKRIDNDRNMQAAIKQEGSEGWLMVRKNAIDPQAPRPIPPGYLRPHWPSGFTPRKLP